MTTFFFAPQAGLSPKVEKPSRKLRKERKNRAKKVCALTSFAASCDRAYFILSVPWNQKVQGFGGYKEGEVNYYLAWNFYLLHVLPFLIVISTRVLLTPL